MSIPIGRRVDIGSGSLIEIKISLNSEFTASKGVLLGRLEPLTMK